MDDWHVGLRQPFDERPTHMPILRPNPKHLSLVVLSPANSV